jgi:hypothetical protein
VIIRASRHKAIAVLHGIKSPLPIRKTRHGASDAGVLISR